MRVSKTSFFPPLAHLGVQNLRDEVLVCRIGDARVGAQLADGALQALLTFQRRQNDAGHPVEAGGARRRVAGPAAVAAGAAVDCRLVHGQPQVLRAGRQLLHHGRQVPLAHGADQLEQ